MVLNTTNLSNSFYGKTSLKDTVFSVLIYGVKHFLIGLRNALMDSCLFSIRNKLIHFSLPLNPVIHWMGIAPKILCPRRREQEESQPYFVFYCKLFKITLRHQWTNQSKIRFKISLSKLLSKPSKWELLLAFNSMMVHS